MAPDRLTLPYVGRSPVTPQRVDGETSLDGIVADLCTVFAASDEVIRPDVEAFFLDLRDKQMLTL